MKKLFIKTVSLMLTLAIAFSTFKVDGFELLYAKAKELTVYPGDYNSDGRITATDLDETMNYLLGYDSFSDELCAVNADVDGNGVINSKDCAHIFNFTLGIEHPKEPLLELNISVTNTILPCVTEGELYDEELFSDAQNSDIYWQGYGFPEGLEIVQNSEGIWKIYGTPQNVREEYIVYLFLLSSGVCEDARAFKINNKSNSQYNVGDVIEFGSYPQSEVTDELLLTKLNSLSLNWISYNYYSGDGSPGSMKAGDWMKYADVTLEGQKYRAVAFTEYRPDITYNSTSTQTSNAGNYYQDNMGYFKDTVYWFKYEPIKWRILDPDFGFVMCETIIDSQPYNNTAYFFADAEEKHEFFNNSWYTKYANDYASSSIRVWLNENFFKTAFTQSQKSAINQTTIENPCSNDRTPEFDSETTKDMIFLLSYDDVHNLEYGFDSKVSQTLTRQAGGTDYAKCQGLYIPTNSDYSTGNYHWLLRTANDSSDGIRTVHSKGYTYYIRSCYLTSLGVRPAMCIDFDMLDNTDEYIEFGSYPQSEVKNETLLQHLNNQNLFWETVSFTYDENIEFVYADTEFNGEKYRAVQKNGNLYANDETNQTYLTNTVYWFKYEPINWLVLDKESGLLLSDKVVNSQPYQEAIYEFSMGDNPIYYQDSSCTVYANNYEKSYIREWLNNEFYKTAFSEKEQSEILTTTLDNSGISSGYDSTTTSDKVFLLSHDEMLNGSYDFGHDEGTTSARENPSPKRRAYATDYSIIHYNAVEENGKSLAYWLRSPGSYSDKAAIVMPFKTGELLGVDHANIGIRPAIRVDLNSENSEKETSNKINIPENIIYIDVNEHYIFNAYSDTGENITNNAVWRYAENVGNEGKFEIVSPGQIKGTKRGLAYLWADYWNADKTEFYGSDSCLVYIGKPSELLYTSIYDTEYGFGEGGFYSDACQISNTVDIYLELNNKIAEEIDFCLEYDKYHDELSELDIGGFTITATVTGDDLSFEKNSYSNTYIQKFDSVPIGMRVNDLLILYPYNLDVSGAQKSYTVSVKIESEDFETITENFSFNVSSLELKNINEHIDFVKNNITYKSFKNEDFASKMASLKNDDQYIWAKYSTMDFNNYYEIMFADILVDLMSAPQTGSLSILPVVKEWANSYNTILSGVSNIVEDNYTGYLDVNENSIDKVIKKSKYTIEGMDVHDELRDFVVLKLRDKVSIDKVNTVFAAVDKTKQFCDFFDLSVDITNDIAEFANCISIINTYKGMNDEFKEVIKNLYYAIPDSESDAKDAVYHYVNIDSEFGYSEEIFNAVKNLAKNITLDVFNSVYKQQFFSLLGKCIGSITLKSGVLLSSTPLFSSISIGLGAVATGASIGLCISDILCNNSGQAEKMGKVVAASAFAPYALQLLDNLEKDMRISKTAISVKLFENAFNLHKAIQIYSLENTFEALKIQADSTIIKKFSDKDYAGLMSDIAAQKIKFENCNCCGSGKSTIEISIKTIEIKCPVDVYVYDENGNEVVRIINDVAEFIQNGISVFIDGSRKYITVPANQEYTIKIIATDDGIMTYSIAEYDETAKWIRTINIPNISLVESEIFIGKINQELSPHQDFYALESEGGLIRPTDIVYPSDESIVVANIDILIPSTTTISYGDTITLHAELNTELPEGAYIRWTADNGNFTIVETSADGTSCKVTPESSGDTTFTATVYDADGNVICEDEQTMTAKAGLFQKFIAFFRWIFGLTKNIPNAIKKYL